MIKTKQTYRFTRNVRDPYCEHGVGLWCDVDAFRAAEEVAWVDLKPDLREGTAVEGPVLELRERKSTWKKGSESGPA